MKEETKIFPKHTCQFCGSDIKLVETIIDDEFFWSEEEQRYLPNGFTDLFDYTGNQRCAKCGEDWTGER